MADDNDIIFNCPKCGKSLSIDRRGAGLLITCPDCQQQVQVPVPEDDDDLADLGQVDTPPVEGEDPQETILNLRDALELSQDKVHRLVNNLEEIRGRRQFLEKMRADNMARFDQIASELSVIQGAIDRLAVVLHDVVSGGPPIRRSGQP